MTKALYSFLDQDIDLAFSTKLEINDVLDRRIKELVEKAERVFARIFSNYCSFKFAELHLELGKPIYLLIWISTKDREKLNKTQQVYHYDWSRDFVPLSYSHTVEFKEY